MIRLTVSDFDGTLMPYGREAVSTSVLSKINTLLESKTTFAVSSGRTYGELSLLLPSLTDKIYFICCDGAVCIYKGRVLYERQISAEDLRHLASLVQIGISLVLHGAFNNYLLGDFFTSEWENATRVKSLYEIREKIFKVTAYGGEIKLPKSCGLRTHWDGGEHKCTQLVNRYSDKGAALSNLQMRLMLTKFDTACIGDSGNDVAMMKGAKYSFCVGKRCGELSVSCTACVSEAEEALDFIIDNI